MANYLRYNVDILAIDCSRCGAPPRDRCRGPRGSKNTQATPAHQARIEAAGYRWDAVAKCLVKAEENGDGDGYSAVPASGRGSAGAASSGYAGARPGA